MADRYVTRKELMEVLRVFTQELSESLGNRIEKIMTQQTDKLLMVLNKAQYVFQVVMLTILQSVIPTGLSLDF